MTINVKRIAVVATCSRSPASTAGNNKQPWQSKRGETNLSGSKGRSTTRGLLRRQLEESPRGRTSTYDTRAGTLEHRQPGEETQYRPSRIGEEVTKTREGRYCGGEKQVGEDGLAKGTQASRVGLSITDKPPQTSRAGTKPIELLNAGNFRAISVACV